MVEVSLQNCRVQIKYWSDPFGGLLERVFMYSTSEHMQIEAKTRLPAPPLSDAEKYTLAMDLSCIIGVNEPERNSPQDISITMDLFTKKHQKIDLISNIEDLAKEIVLHAKPFLLERMCYRIAVDLTRAFPVITCLSITIKKPHAIP